MPTSSLLPTPRALVPRAAARCIAHGALYHRSIELLNHQVRVRAGTGVLGTPRRRSGSDLGSGPCMRERASAKSFAMPGMCCAHSMLVPSSAPSNEISRRTMLSAGLEEAPLEDARRAPRLSDRTETLAWR